MFPTTHTLEECEAPKLLTDCVGSVGGCSSAGKRKMESITLPIVRYALYAVSAEILGVDWQSVYSMRPQILASTPWCPQDLRGNLLSSWDLSLQPHHCITRHPCQSQAPAAVEPSELRQASNLTTPASKHKVILRTCPTAPMNCSARSPKNKSRDESPPEPVLCSAVPTISPPDAV